MEEIVVSFFLRLLGDPNKITHAQPLVGVVSPSAANEISRPAPSSKFRNFEEGFYSKLRGDVTPSVGAVSLCREPFGRALPPTRIALNELPPRRPAPTIL